ncbi:hypothetical protein M5K25_002771 [Dendrobium thyrsiflorum]|uniref:Radical SAM core domain-containing protein n=1 Tax=Dendrobium thyrsiflorum TaxID=117978 RepID=A0ABD0VUT5_DENTH
MGHLSAVRLFESLFRYDQSLSVLKHGKLFKEGMITKSSIMLGLGESDDEVKEAMGDLRTIGVDILTLGQYLQPTPLHLTVKEYVTPEKFAFWKDYGESIGFRYVASGPLVKQLFLLRQEPVFLPPAENRNTLFLHPAENRNTVFLHPAENRNTVFLHPAENRNTLFLHPAENRNTVFLHPAENRNTLPYPAENRYPFSPLPGEGREPGTMLTKAEKPLQSLLFLPFSPLHGDGREPVFLPPAENRNTLFLHPAENRNTVFLHPAENRNTVFLHPAENRNTLFLHPAENRNTVFLHPAENRNTLPYPAENRYPFSPLPGEGREPGTMLTYSTRKPPKMMGRDLEKIRRSSLLGNLVIPLTIPSLNLSISLSQSLPLIQWSLSNEVLNKGSYLC